MSPLCLRIADGYTGGLPDTAAVELSTRLFIEDGSGLDRGLSSISIISVLKILFIKGDSILTSFSNYLLGDDP